MSQLDIRILLKTFLGDIEIPDELITEFEGFMVMSYDEGYTDGLIDGEDYD